MKAHFCYRVLVVVARKGNMAIYPVAARQKIQTIISHSARRPQVLIIGTMLGQVARDKTDGMYETVHIPGITSMNYIVDLHQLCIGFAARY